MSGRYFYTHWLSDANVSKTNLLQARPGQDFTYQALSGSDTYAFTLINTFLVSYDRNAGNTGPGAPFGVDSLGSAVPAPTNTAPEIRISVGSGLWSIETNHFRQINRASLQFADTIHWVHGMGSKGTHLAYNIDANAAFNGGNVPDPNFGVVTESVSGGNSIYHSLQLSLEKRFSKGFSIAGNYSLNHNNDWVSYQSDTDSINVINPFDPRAYAGTSDLEIRQRLTLRSLWEIPGPKTGLMRGIFGGWQTSGIWSWQSGMPFSIFCGCDNTGTGIGNDLADQVGPHRRQGADTR